MNAITIALAVVVASAIVAGVIGLILKNYIARATFIAGLSTEDRKEMAEMKVFLDNMRRERSEQNTDQAKRAGRIEAQIEYLGKATGTLDANTMKLERALRGDAQAMGNWGEMQLKKVLDMSGLTEGISYTYQETLASDDSTRRNLRTDVQIKLPNDKVIVIDSKTTTPSYLDYNAAATEEARAEQEKRIIDSVRKHMDEIIAAKYQKSIKNCFPKVIMYFPFEIPYLLACRAEVKIGSDKAWLREYAYKNDIIFATASNLLPILDGVAFIWAAQGQDAKMKKFLGEAGKLCDKMHTFLRSYQTMGTQLAALGKSYREGMGQLAEGPGNVLKKLSDLKDAQVESAIKIPSGEELIAHADKVTEGLSSHDYNLTLAIRGGT